MHFLCSYCHNKFGAAMKQARTLEKLYGVSQCYKNARAFAGRGGHLKKASQIKRVKSAALITTVITLALV